MAFFLKNQCLRLRVTQFASLFPLPEFSDAHNCHYIERSMIFVGGDSFNFANSSSSSSSQGSNLLLDLMKHPILESVSQSFKSIQERKVSSREYGSEGLTKSKYVYIFQREYATVHPGLVDFVGTDEATTCVGLVIRNQLTGMTSVAHLDSPKVVDFGLTQMLSLIVDDTSDADLDVHLIGGFEDIASKHAHSTTGSERISKPDGYSFPLCTKIIESLQKRPENFHIKTLFVLGHNTKWDSQGNAYPIFHGFMVETSTGLGFPASFDRTSRCPDEIVRRLRVSASYEDITWHGKLLETYDTQTDMFIIAPCCWTLRLKRIAFSIQCLSDAEILHQCSTSPLAEGPDFVDNMRRIWDYVLKYPDWNITFSRKQPRIFERTKGGDWKRC